MADELDDLLRSLRLAPPADFAERVLAAIAARSDPEPVTATPSRRRRELVEWLAVAATVLLGLPQLAMFLFGVWTVSGAG